MDTNPDNMPGEPVGNTWRDRWGRTWSTRRRPILSGCGVLLLLVALVIAAIYLSNRSKTANEPPAPDPVAEMQNQITALETGQSELNTSVDAVSGDVDQLKTDVSGLATSVNDLTEASNDLLAVMTARLEEVITVTSNLVDQVSGMKAEVGTLTAEVEQANANASSASEQAAEALALASNPQVPAVQPAGSSGASASSSAAIAPGSAITGTQVSGAAMAVNMTFLGPWGVYKPGDFSIGEYPVNGSQEAQEDYVSELVDCLVRKIPGENAGFYVNYKGGTPQMCANPVGFLGTVHLASLSRTSTDILPFTMTLKEQYFGDGVKVPTWAATYRLTALYPEGPCKMTENALKNAVEETFDLWVVEELSPPTNCPVPDLSGADPSFALETAEMQKIFGISLIRIGTIHAYQVQQLGNGSFSVPNLEGYFYELHFADGHAEFAQGVAGGTPYTDVTHVIIYPAKYFTACEAFSRANVAANSSFSQSTCVP